MEAPIKRTEWYCKTEAPNERTEQRESDGDGDDMEADILQHAHVLINIRHLYLTQVLLGFLIDWFFVQLMIITL